MNCTNCGNEVPDTAKVCGYCGQRLTTNQTSPLNAGRGTAWILWALGGTLFVGLAAILGIGAIYFLKISRNNLPIQPQPTTAQTPVSTPSFTLSPAPLPTFTSTPSFTPEPSTTPTLIILPEQWNGVYNQAGIGKLSIIITIDKVNGNSFSGKMFWKATDRFRGAVTWISGEFMTDFGDEEEQAKWGNVPDYRDGQRDGVWIKWTETGFADGGGYTLGGWYYGHIRENGKMAGIYYLNEKISSFAKSDSWELTKYK